MDNYIETLFNIPIFSSEDGDYCEEGYWYSNIKFYIHSLKKYDGLDLSVNYNWDIVILDKGETIDKFNIFEIKDFRNELNNKE